MSFIALDNTVRSLSPDKIGYAQVAAAAAAGTAVYLNASGKLAVADATDAVGGECDGILLADANAADQWIPYAKNGSRLTGLTSLTPGAALFLAESDVGGNAGEVTDDPVTDNVTTDSYFTLVGVAHSATDVTLTLVETGAQV